MTSLPVMLRWFAPDTATVDTTCSVCGAGITVSKRNNKPMCQDCADERRAERDNHKYQRKNKVLYDRFGDPSIDLAYAVINRALEDREWRRKLRDDEPLSLKECSAQDFIADGGVELWLQALGLNIRPSMSKAIRNMEA